MDSAEDFELDPERLEAERAHEMAMLDIERTAWIERNSPILTTDLLSRKIRRPPWLFEDFLLSHTLTMISGEPFAGKSLFMMAMLVSFDSGEPLVGSYPVAPHQKALFIGQDSPTWDYYGQYQKLGRALQLPVERFNPSMLLINKGLNILDPPTMQLIVEAVDLFGVTVLMLDTLLEMHSLNENDNDQMKKVMNALKWLRDKHNLSVFFTTHTGKDGEGKSLNYRARGASVISGSPDQHILISSHPEGGFKIKAPKTRGQDRKKETQYIKFAPMLINDEPALGLVHSEDLYREREKHILSTFGDRKPHARKEVMAILHGAYPEWDATELGQRTSNSLRYLVVKGLLAKTEWGIYTLAESPQPKAASNPA